MRDLLRTPGFGPYLLSRLLARAAGAALSILLGVAVYRAAGTALALGWLGLAQALPAIFLVLLGGHVADRHSRRGLAIGTTAALAALILALALVYAFAPQHALPALFLLGFGSGVISAFADPAFSGLEAQVIPAHLAVQGASTLGTAQRATGLTAPVFAGLLYDAAGPGATYTLLALLTLASALTLLIGVPPRPTPPHTHHPRLLEHVAEGVRYVFADQILVGSMALDLFAVFFGGAAGLFPVFAEMLGVGSSGVGLMRGAASAGALLAMAIIVRHPPRRRAGVLLHLSIAGFGLGIIVFGLSTSFALSLAALFFVGLCDGLNVVIRQAIVRLAAPEAMRGRIAAVRMVFVNSSNELGEFESGMTAAWLGPVIATWGGGVVTLLVVGATALLAPRLRALDLGAVGPK